LQIALKSQFPITSVQLTAETASTPFYQQLIIDDRQPAKGISSLWARRKIEDLVDSLIVGANKEQVKVSGYRHVAQSSNNIALHQFYCGRKAASKSFYADKK